MTVCLSCFLWGWGRVSEMKRGTVLQISSSPCDSCLYLWRSEEGWKLIRWHRLWQPLLSSRQSVCLPPSSHFSVSSCRRITKDARGPWGQTSRRSTDSCRLVVPRSRLSVCSSLLNSAAAACWLQQEHEVQLCQEYDSSYPLVFLPVSPLSPYCQSEECTSVETSLWNTTEKHSCFAMPK